MNFNPVKIGAFAGAKSTKFIQAVILQPIKRATPEAQMIADWHWTTIDYVFIAGIKFFVNFSKKFGCRFSNFVLKFYGDDD